MRHIHTVGDLSALNFINVGRQGTFRPTGSLRSSPTDVDQIAAAIKDSSRPAVLHFHGGLVPEAKGIATASALTPMYESTGCHPISILWETGFLETARRNLHTIHRTDLFRELLKIVLERAANKIGVSIGSRGGPVRITPQTIEDELDRPVPFADELFPPSTQARGGAVLGEPSLEEIEEEIRLELQVRTAVAEFLERPDQVAPLEPDYRRQAEMAQRGARGVPFWLVKPLAMVTFRVARRFWNGRSHGFYTTVIEEILRELYLASIGAWVWSGMKNAGTDMFRSNGGRSGDNLHAGLYLIQRLAETNVTLHLVGHSAGSIAICELLAASAQQGIHLKLGNIIFLAPACTSELFWREIGSRPERFANFRMFTMHDEYESKDLLVPYAYPRSLLYLISGILEQEADMALAGMHRFLTGTPPYNSQTLLSIQNFLQHSGRMVLSKTADGSLEGLRCGAVGHGGFDEDETTRESLVHLLRA